MKRGGGAWLPKRARVIRKSGGYGGKKEHDLKEVKG